MKDEFNILASDLMVLGFTPCYVKCGEYKKTGYTSDFIYLICEFDFLDGEITLLSTDIDVGMQNKSIMDMEEGWYRGAEFKVHFFNDHRGKYLKFEEVKYLVELFNSLEKR